MSLTAAPCKELRCGISSTGRIQLANGLDVVFTVASIVNFLLGRGNELNLKGLPSDLRKSVKRLHQEGDLVGAAELLFQHNQFEPAAALFSELNMPTRAAEAQEQAGNAAQAVALYKRAGDHTRAAELYAELGQFESAGEEMLEAGLQERAAELFSKGGQHRKAADLFQQKGHWLNAAKCYGDAGDTPMQMEMFVRAFEHEYDIARGNIKLIGVARAMARQAAIWFIESGDDEKRGVSLLEKAGFDADEVIAAHKAKAAEKARKAEAKAAEPAKVASGTNSGQKPSSRPEASWNDPEAPLLKKAQQAEERGEFEQARQLYQNAGREDLAAGAMAQLALMSGELEQAANLHAKAGNYKRAADLFLDLRQNSRAATMYLRGKQYSRAGELFEKAGALGKAAKSYEAGKDYARAAAMFAKLGDATGELRVANAMQDFYRVGRLLVSMDKLDEASQALRKVTRDDPKFNESIELLGDIFWKRRSYQSAFAAYRDALDKQEPGLENLHLLYKMARCLENENDLDAAIETLSKVISVDETYRDVRPRRAKLRSALKNRNNKLAGNKGTSADAANGRNGGASNKAASPSSQEKGKAQQKASAVLKRPSRPSVPRTSAVRRQSSPSMQSVDTQPSKQVDQNRGQERYEIVDEVARGGMGVVYRARDTFLNRIVAYKILSAQLRDNKHAREYFLREARAAAKLQHTNIVTIFDAGIQDGELFMAMEYVDGKTLKQIVTRTGSFPEKLVLYIARHSCRGLQYAHERGIVHRDIKSGNIMLTNKDKILKIMDFGLAKVIKEHQQDHTRAIGTPFYMSPEQVLGNDLDNRSDIYSLGVTLFEIATGVVPFTKGDLGYAHVHRDPPRPRSLNPKLSERLEHVILKCMEKSPDDRFTTCDELVAALSR